MEKQMHELVLGKVAEVELRYVTKTKSSERPLISSSCDAYRIFLRCWKEEELELREAFKVLLLNRANRVLCQYAVSYGGITGTVADPRLICTAALRVNAVSMILAHNHPSGNLRPSTADEEVTQKIKAAAAVLDMKVLDHLILTCDTYFSFADEGLI